MFVKLWAVVSTVVASAMAGTRYDYIIVGGGTSGTALATRLSQGLPNSKILLLEAGPAAPDELRINIPGMRGSTLFSIYDWNFTTVPQENVAGRQIDVNRGRVLGGSSALNYLCYDRAASAEYDAWGELCGDEAAWNWDVMLEAMKKAENYTGEDPNFDIQGDDGPIRNDFSRIRPAQLETWIPTMNALGIPTITEYMGGDIIGVMYQGTNVDTTHWTRSYSANSYLPLAGSNLEVMTDSRVARVMFKKRRKPLKAIGVELEDGTKFYARKEVILSAGTVQSPGLLELSGIGQTEVIEAAGITPLLDLPGVGENFQDHIRTQNSWILKDNYSSFDPFIYEPTGDLATEQLQLWLDGEVSWYDYTSSAYSFMNWNQIVGEELAAEMTRMAEEGVGERGSSVDMKKLEWLNDPSIPQLEIIMENNYVGIQGYPGDGAKLITLFTSIMHPLSRGHVHIDPENPLGSPIIDPNFLANEYDLQAIVETAKFCRKIAETEPMASIWEAEYEPGAEVQTDEEWREWALQSMATFFHPVGSCAMLPKEENGVVNQELKVYGTQNLRVVDCSIIPVIISAHTQTAAYGIAEVAADMIIQDAMKRAAEGIEEEEDEDLEEEDE